jgi:hypothetical protein
VVDVLSGRRTPEVPPKRWSEKIGTLGIFNSYSVLSLILSEPYVRIADTYAATTGFNGEDSLAM